MPCLREDFLYPRLTKVDECAWSWNHHDNPKWNGLFGGHTYMSVSCYLPIQTCLHGGVHIDNITKFMSIHRHTKYNVCVWSKSTTQKELPALYSAVIFFLQMESTSCVWRCSMDVQNKTCVIKNNWNKCTTLRCPSMCLCYMVAYLQQSRAG